MPKRAFNNIEGRRFGRYMVMEFVPDNSKFSKFRCVCDCGVEKVVMAQSLIAGLTKSCGCFANEKWNTPRTHGQSGKNRTGAYNSWAGMMDRSEWGGHPSYAKYGAIGLRVEKSWHQFENFLADMGERPQGASIDQIDNDKGYSAENCRWADKHTQMMNRSNTLRVVYQGEVVTVMDLCRQLGIKLTTFKARATRRGKDLVKTFLTFGVVVEASPKSTFRA